VPTTVSQPQPTATAPARPALNQPVAAHIGAIAETLTLAGRVAAAEEVPLAFGEKMSIRSISVKAGQTVEEGQVLVSGDSTDLQSQLDSLKGRLDADTASLGQAQAALDAQQRAAARQVASAQQAQADRIAAAQANLSTARANLQKVQAGASQTDIQAAQNAVTSAQLAAHKADDAEAKVANGPDDTEVHNAEQSLANAQAALVKAKADLAAAGGSLPDDSNPAPADVPTAFAAENISPPAVSTDPNNPKNNFGFLGIAADPAKSGTVYVGTDYQGLWKTTDGGHTWAKTNTGTNGKELDSGGLWLVVIDPLDDQIIYTAPGYGVGGLWKSVDGGVNWTPLFPPNSPVVQAIGTAPTPTNLSIDPANHLHMIASSHFPWNGKYSSANGVGVLETSDGGNSWTIHDPIPNSGAEHEVALIDSATWLESWNGNTYRTTDAGAHWTKVLDSNGETQNMLTVNGVLYLPAPSGMFRSTDNGASWKMVGPGGMAIVSDGKYLYTQQSGPGGGHQEPLFFSPASDGTSWSQYSSQSMCSANACNGPGWVAADGQTLYMSNWTAGVWKLQTVGGAPISSAPAPTIKANNSGNTQQPDIVGARQRLVAAQDAVNAARAKLEALRNGPDQDTVDSAQLGSSSAQMALAAAQAHLNDLLRGPAPADLRAAQDAVTLAQTALDRARQPVDPGDAGTDPNATDGGIQARQKAIDKDNADIAALQARIAAADIKSPFAGTVVSVFFRVGDSTDQNHTVVSVAKPGTPIARATITPADFDKVSVGQTALIQLPGQGDGDPVINAQVTALKPNDAGSAKIADLSVDWPDSAPKLGSVVNVGLVLQQKSDALLVPKKAVHTTGSRSFVELVDGKNRKVTTVQVGIVSGSDAEIVSGLTQGQLVMVGP
jgi:multidrug efflux pump subunit AcrA (membrane-fusion protein)/photosystem II stability/assembly factor-like uncharacterized protein